jgi:transposase
MEKRYIVNLTNDERAALEAMLSKGRVSALKLQRARILLAADDGLTDADIADHLDTARSTVENVRRRCVLEGLEAVLDRKKQDRPSRPPKLDGAAEARLVQLACSAPPKGRARWTLSLLADKLVELAIVDTVSVTTVHRRLKKKPAQAVARGTVLHTPRQLRRLRARDGGRPRRLSPTV